MDKIAVKQPLKINFGHLGLVKFVCLRYDLKKELTMNE